MSRDFIGSKIAIITKSQSRYVGTIIGIDTQTSSVLLGDVKCFGTENRSSSLATAHKAGTVLPIMQFANSDIEDLKIVDESQSGDTPQQQTCPVPSTATSSVHDDPAILSAVVSSSYQAISSNQAETNQLMKDLQQMSLSDAKSKHGESRKHLNSGDSGPTWPLFPPSKWETNNDTHKSTSKQHSNNKSKFFDDFTSDSNRTPKEPQSNHSQPRTFHNHVSQAFRENGTHHNGQFEENGLPVRQPFFTDDNPYPERSQQQRNRYQRGDNTQYQQKYFNNNPRGPKLNQQRYGGNRETFRGDANDLAHDFDFESNNRQFNKITNEEDLKIDQPSHIQTNNNSTDEFPLSYDKKKSFFDNLVLTEQSNPSTSTHGFSHPKNRDTFGNDGYQRYHHHHHAGRSNNNNNGYRRSNNNQRQHHYGNDDFHYKQYSKNSYQQRY